MLYPLKFHPIFKERVWGGRQIEARFGKKLPPEKRIGESWEISDRPGDVSVIANGPLAGKDLRWLMENHPGELLGPRRAAPERFPLLVKILDASEKLSLQVHPPAAMARTLRGEPKTELWYVAAAEPGADLYAGLKRGVTRAEFEAKLRAGTVADCFHRLPVRAHDAMFVPSGRVHAIGAGCVIFEIQQNSDTTFRVFDWNRLGLDGAPRELHIAQSLCCIDFDDFEPVLISRAPGVREQLLVRDPLFEARRVRLERGERFEHKPGIMAIVGVIEGRVAAADPPAPVEARAGEFILFPAAGAAASLQALEGSDLLAAHAAPVAANQP